MALLLWRIAQGDRLRQWSVGIFGLSMILLYGASGIYHGLPASSPELVELFRLLDHSAIYLLIAGTYTPVLAVLLSGRLRTVLLSLVWGIAWIGIACKWLLPAPPYPLTVGLYIAMGWVGLIPVVQLVKAVGLRAMMVGLSGGACYTVGAICDALDWPVLIPGVIGGHEVFHCLDVLATGIHFYFILRYVIPFRRPKVGVASVVDGQTADASTVAERVQSSRALPTPTR